MRAFAIAAVFMLGSVAHAQTRSIDDMQWLTGCWERAGSAGRTVEVWSSPADGALLGGSYFVTDSTIRELEQLRLWYSGDTLVYEAHPSSQSRTEFKAGSPGRDEMVFENPAHDFPQRITYRRAGADSLIARIEGDRAGRRQPVTFAFRRAECGELAPSVALLARVRLQRMYDEMATAEANAAGRRLSWLVERALGGYTYTVWAAPGSSVAVWDVPTIRRNVEALRRGAANTPPETRTYAASVDRVLVRGDTMEALVTGRLARTFVDAEGRMGAAGQRHERATVQRWIDTWVREGGTLRLLSTATIAEEVRMDGRPIVIDGVPVRVPAP